MTIQQLQVIRNRQAEIHNHLDASGIGNDVHNRFSQAADLVAKFCADFQAKAMKQLSYDLMQNVPTGIIQRGDANYHANHAIEHAIISCTSSFVHWDVTRALELAADIAEDVNAHSEAAKIREMAAQPLTA